MTVSTAKEEGDYNYKAGRFHEAIIHYTNAIAGKHPELHICYSNRSACYLRIIGGDVNHYTAKALADAEECIRLKPSWFKGHSRRGECLMRMNRTDEAMRAYEKVLECDPNNTEAINALASARRRRDYGGNGSGGNSSAQDRNRTQQPPPQSQQPSMGLAEMAQLACMKAMNYWMSLPQETQRLVQLAVFGLIAYYLFFSSSYGYGNYGYDYGGYGGYSGGGLTWMQWGAIMLAAYKVPPMFPDVLGAYARPFFGMNWTTFMWLLNMFTANRGGRRMHPGYGGGYGGMFGRRRYY